MYSACKDTIRIPKNNSIYNNDYMKNRLEQLCVPNIKSSVDFLDEDYWMNTDLNNESREKHPKDNLNIELFINAKNETSDIMNVTTNDCILKVNDKQVDKFDKKFPNLIIKLRPDEYFECNIKFVLGVGEKNAIWSPIKNCFFTYDENDKKNNFNFSIKSKGQEDEFEIIKKTCKIIKNKLLKIKNLVEINFKDINHNETVIIVIQNEDHTIGNLITTALQENKDVKFAGYGQPDLLKKEIVIKFISSNKKNPLKPFFDSINYLNDLYTDIEKKISKLK